MEQSVFPPRFSEDRRDFYLHFLRFARQYPDMKISLYVPRHDLPLLAREDWSEIVRSLLDLCRSGRLTLMGMAPRSHLLDYLHQVNKFGSVACPPD